MTAPEPRNTTTFMSGTITASGGDLPEPVHVDAQLLTAGQFGGWVAAHARRHGLLRRDLAVTITYAGPWPEEAEEVTGGE